MATNSRHGKIFSTMIVGSSQGTSTSISNVSSSGSSIGNFVSSACTFFVGIPIFW